MRIISCNVNGIRSADKKGFFDWINSKNPDFVCLQETKAQLEKLNLLNFNACVDSVSFYLDQYFCFESPALRPGYSGVAVYAKKKPLSIKKQMGFACADNEGRFIQVDYADFSLISIYFPSGTSGEHRQTEKYHFLHQCSDFFNKLVNSQQPCIICGDFNIAHKMIDIKNWRANQKHSGFLPAERQWLDQLFEKSDWIDAFRVINQADQQYTWWSNRGRAYEKNVGWRIDYQIATAHWKNKIQAVEIYKEKRFSDHAPLIIDYAL